MLPIRHKLESILTSGNGEGQRPALGKNFQSSVKNLHIIGDLAGAPVIKLAMSQGVEVIEHIASQPEIGRGAGHDEVLDVLIVGAGAAGLNAALAAQEKGLRYLLLEKSKIANTIENFPEGKWVYAEPDEQPPKGKLWLDGARKEDLIARWHRIVEENGLDVKVEEGLEKAERQDGLFHARTSKGNLYKAKRLVLATGMRGNPRKLEVPGEDQERVYHRLYSPKQYENEEILVVGGGNSAVEAALTLSERNKVVVSYRGGEFSRVFKENKKELDQAISQGRIQVIFHSQVTRFGQGQTELTVDRGGHEEEKTVRSDHAFVLIGSQVPVEFLKGLGVRMENEWSGSALAALGLTALTLLALWFAGPLMGGPAPLQMSALSAYAGLALALAGAGAAGLIATGLAGNRWSWLGLSFFCWYSVYGIKVGSGQEFWPYTGWGYDSMSFFGRSWAFWYTVMYTALMTVFGLEALKRWGLDRKDRFQVWRFVSLLAFQWTFFFIVPEFLFRWAVEYQWVGQALANDPQFADQAWRAYGIVYAWPLFFYTFFYDPHVIWVVWGVVLTFVLIPILVLFHGKRYCSWICGCGGLAETFGDRWRHYAPKGPASIGWERMGSWVMVAAFAVTLAMLTRDLTGLYQTADWSIYGYRIVADVWLVGILPVTLYPFMGGKIWCRYWCPLAKMMQINSWIYSKLGISRYHIASNEKCIACNECSRNCLVGIDVMKFALKQQTLDNGNSSCIGCGICVTVCPVDTLHFSKDGSLPEGAQK
ncbi:MAG TPA: NAD(P)-binding domain-containing protein [Acidobacteriota bacterium]|nr:NAD(P)-binding domain-containing protein [Acidobacteriota bacterium]